MVPVKPSQTLSKKPLPPQPDGVDAAAHLSCHCTLSLAFRESENDVTATNVLCRQSSAADSGLQFSFGRGAHFEFGWHPCRVSDQCIRCQCYSALAFCISALEKP